MSDFKLYTNFCEHYGTKEQTQISYEDIVFPYFPSRVNAVVPLGLVSLQQFLDSHRDPKPKIVKVFESIREATEAGDEELKAELKQNNLYYFTPTVQLEYRNYESIQAFNPLMVAEYDKVGESRANRLKKAIFERFSSCVCAYLSPSRVGVKFLFRIPTVKTVEEYKEYFYGLAYYLSQVDGFDEINANPTQPLFISYDTDILIRPQDEVEEWKVRGYKPNSFRMYDGELKEVQASEEERARVFSNIQKAIEKIEDNGHFQVRAAATSIGGYVAAGYVSFEEAEEYIHELIEQNEYLSKGTKGYQRTASEMMQRGMNSPLYLD